MPFTHAEITAHNLSLKEYDRIEELLGREPTPVELGVFSVMWSEHCSYKSSRIHLKRLPTTGARVIVPPGENAGVVDVGDGWCAAFKVESHNHPSFIEPFQGAATGVGGILRDVFTMGARPVALMNSLRFGALDHPTNGTRNRRLLAGVVDGIAHYGNCFGTATVGGEVVFDDAYALNPLVNAFALGLVRQDQIFFGKATGVGNPVLYVGAKTGRDGIHGATMASAEFDEEALEKRPTVQVGDPFLEKLLLEACLEAMRSGAIAGIQDMGAAGLTSSSCEMAARAGTGLELNLDLVPQREMNMTAYEMLLSESQERMLIVAHAGREREVVEIFQKWDLDAVVIGRVIEGDKMIIKHHGITEAAIPVAALTDEAPRYERPMSPKPAASPKSKVQSPKSDGSVSSSAVRNPQSAIRNQNYNAALLKLLALPTIASKEWVYRQYDHMVRTNTTVLPGADAAVIRIKETRRALAMCLDGNGLYCAVEPRRGAELTVAEAARNVACVGAQPLAITNCLNFASPERPEVMRAFSEVIDGISEACTQLGTPVVSGNVSFYNETTDEAGNVSGVLPTPVIGMVGLLEDARRVVTQGFKGAGEIIAILGATAGEDLSVGAFAAVVAGKTTAEMIADGALPALDWELEKSVQSACVKLAESGLLKAAHDCADGGLAVALAEICFSSLGRAAIGAKIDLPETENVSGAAQLFAETPSRIIISYTPEAAEQVAAVAAAQNCPLKIIGETGGELLSIRTGDAQVIAQKVAELEQTWRTALAAQIKPDALTPTA